MDIDAIVLNKIVAYPVTHKKGNTSCLSGFYSKNAKVVNIQKSLNAIPTLTERKRKKEESAVESTFEKT